MRASSGRYRKVCSITDWADPARVPVVAGYLPWHRGRRDAVAAECWVRRDSRGWPRRRAGRPDGVGARARRGGQAVRGVGGWSSRTGREERPVLRAGKVELRARDEADVAVLHAELYEDIATRTQADSRPWRPIPAGSASPYAVGEPRDDLACFSVVEL